MAEVDLVTANAYKEVLEILKYVTEEDYNKIPKDYIQMFLDHCNDDYEFVYDPQKDIEEQDLMEETKFYLAILFQKFWATDGQKQKIQAYQNRYFVEEERRKREEEKIKVDAAESQKILQELEELEDIDDEIKFVSEKDLVKSKNGFFSNLIKKIKNIFFE